MAGTWAWVCWMTAACVLAGCAATTPPGTASSTTQAPACPDPHWHGSFAVFIPGARQADGSDAPQRVDYAGPRMGGHPYYEYGVDPAMDRDMHMHQEGPEVGGADAQGRPLGPAQMHFEGGRCIPLSDALLKAETRVSGQELELTGHHADVGQKASFSAHGAQRVRTWVQHLNGSWQEMPPAALLAQQLRDGQGALVAFGNFTAPSVKQMQDAVPTPDGRARRLAAGESY